MKKVFYRCVECINKIGFTVGNEYERHGDNVFSDSGVKWVASLLEHNQLVSAKFTRIEREFFEVGGFTWFRDTPGDPMPCADEAVMTLSWGDGIADDTAEIRWPGFFTVIQSGAKNEEYQLCFENAEYKSITQAQPIQGPFVGGVELYDAEAGVYISGVGVNVFVDIAIGEPCNEIIVCSGLPVLPFESAFVPVCVAPGERVSARIVGYDGTANISLDGRVFFSRGAQAQSVSAIEDSSLSPAQRKHWEAMEAKQAAKEQLKHDAEAKALQERAKQLSDAGNAMDRVSQDHGHKLGWR